jgi:hypothetical protein
MESLAASLPGGVSILLKHAAITIARTAQNLADFGIVDVLPGKLRALSNGAVVTEDFLCSPPRD